jgi:hypothetical protein
VTRRAGSDTHPGRASRDRSRPPARRSMPRDRRDRCRPPMRRPACGSAPAWRGAVWARPGRAAAAVVGARHLAEGKGRRSRRAGPSCPCREGGTRDAGRATCCRAREAVGRAVARRAERPARVRADHQNLWRVLVVAGRRRACAMDAWRLPDRLWAVLEPLARIIHRPSRTEGNGGDGCDWKDRVAPRGAQPRE